MVQKVGRSRARGRIRRDINAVRSFDMQMSTFENGNFVGWKTRAEKCINKQGQGLKLKYTPFVVTQCHGRGYL